MSRKPFIRHAAKPQAAVLILIGGLFVWLFADALFGSGMFAFRDAGHFYYPLFRMICDEWAAGGVPLWNPYENLGQPLLGNPTSSVFYPGKLIFALPQGYDCNYKLYILAHLLLAAWAAYRLARQLGSSVEAAGVCSLSYAFCGNVLFQYANVVFLVGAAWLPLAMLAAAKALGPGRTAWAVVLGIVLAMMVLGGDPQMAYNAGLLAALYAVWLWWRESPLSLWERVRVRAAQVADFNSTNPHPGPLPKGEGVWKSRPVLLAIAAVVGLTLSAVQVLPSLEFAGLSDRGTPELRERFLARSPANTHAEHAYHFSVGPWRLAEYVWPNVSGRQFPTHRRWLEVIPAEARLWTPSLYMGLVPLLLALSIIRLPKPPKRVLTPFLFLVAGFGWFGVGWVVMEVQVAVGGEPTELVGAPFGGLYWLMNLVLPGYAYFRYPAKLLVLAALGFSVLAARGFDRAMAGPSKGLLRGLLALAVVSAAGVVGVLIVRPFWHGWLSSVEPDMMFGPLDTAGAATDLLWAFGQTAVVCLLAWWLLKRAGENRRWPAMALVLLVAIDLGLANRWMVADATVDRPDEPSEVARAIQRHEQTGDGQPYRVWRHPLWMPPEWKAVGSPNRLEEALRWDRDTLWPKHNLGYHLPVAEVHGTMSLAAYREFLRQGNARSLAKYVILPGDQTLPGGRRIDVPTGDVSLWYNPTHLPRAWIAEESAMDEIAPRRLPGESCRVVFHGPSEVQLEAQLIRPGLVVLSDQFYPGWQLEVQTPGQAARTAEILPAHGVMRAARLPAGKHRLIYRYRPASFYWGAILSGLGWLVVAVGLMWCWKARRQRVT